MPKISIILPTYNVERYFRECIESLIGQTLTDIEIIPVDDGSPDNCGAIMDEYAQRDPRIKPIHQANGGYGSAVNNGFAAATGEYLAIVEPDDWCESDMYERLYAQAKRFDADLCKCGFYVYNSKRSGNQNIEWHTKSVSIGSLPDDRNFTLSEVPIFVQLHASIWSNIYRRKFIVDNNIRVNSTAGASYQDIPFMVEVASRAKRIAAIHDLLYHWRVEPGQMSSSNARGAKMMVIAEQCAEATEIAERYDLLETLRDELCTQYYTVNITFYINIERRYKKEYREKLRRLFAPLYTDPNYKNPYFTPLQESFVREYILEDRTLCRWSLTQFRRSLFQLHLGRNHRKFIFLGTTIYDAQR